MDNRHESTYRIMSAALTLFRKNGYALTGIRQIADTSGVSLGLVNHYFGSKRILARDALCLLENFLGTLIHPYVDLDTQPLLFDLLATRFQIDFFLNGPYHQFYLDTLREGIYFDSVMQYPNQTQQALRKAYHFPDNEDYILLFNRYVPCDIEKTLVLQKEVGQFQNISYDDIPRLVCTAALQRFIPMGEIEKADRDSLPILNEILKQSPFTPFNPSEDYIRSYLSCTDIHEEH